MGLDKLKFDKIMSVLKQELLVHSRCCGLKLVLVPFFFLTGSLFIFFCHIFITITSGKMANKFETSQIDFCC